MSSITVTRFHDFSAGHRVVGHESKCAWLHGHNYRAHFTCTAPSLDSIGRVIDFSAIKSTLCAWLEEQWDHKFLAWEDDPQIRGMVRQSFHYDAFLGASIRWVPFNPTAENMARYLVEVIGPQQLPPEIELIKVTIDETRRCSATYEKRAER